MSTRTRRCCAAALVLGLAVLAGCGEVPQRKDAAPISKVAADGREIDAIYGRYTDVRANALKLLDPEPLGTVESGPVLAIDSGALQVAKRLQATQPFDPEQDLEIQRVLSPRLDAYPLWFVAIVRDNVKKVTKVQIFSRSSATAEWTMVASPEALLSTRLPAFATDDAGSLETIEPKDGAGLAATPAQAITDYAAALRDPQGAEAKKVVDDSFIQQMRQVAGQSSAIKGVTFSQSWGARPVEFAMRTEDGGALVVATLLRQDGYEIADGVEVSWPEGSAQKAFLSDKLYTAGLLRYYHQVLLYVPPEGDGLPRVLAQYGGVVDGEGF
ncbi:hypothetical protein [Solicola sp. PLA-1-18]|uniref:hypothetical protein n=1 Tax=Solicola sp. PLA-1-18 TaxID=3380532 RepID=UPI003B822619